MKWDKINTFLEYYSCFKIYRKYSFTLANQAIGGGNK